MESSLQKIQRGEKLTLLTPVVVEGQKWTITARTSSDDKRPTIEFFRKETKGKMPLKRKCIKIRYGDEP